MPGFLGTQPELIFCCTFFSAFSCKNNSVSSEHDACLLTNSINIELSQPNLNFQSSICKRENMHLKSSTCSSTKAEHLIIHKSNQTRNLIPTINTMAGCFLWQLQFIELYTDMRVKIPHTMLTVITKMETAICLPAVAGAGVCNIWSCERSVQHCHQYVQNCGDGHVGSIFTGGQISHRFSYLL